MNSVLSAGVAGVQSGLRNAYDAAEKINAATISPQQAAGAATTVAPPSADGIDSITEGAVQLKASELQVQASAAVIKTADDVIGTLIDTKA